MSCFAVLRQAGPAWADGKGIFEQPGVDEHARFMNTLAEDGFVLLAGPRSTATNGAASARC